MKEYDTFSLFFESSREKYYYGIGQIKKKSLNQKL
jgi:hypothetical protein